MGEQGDLFTSSAKELRDQALARIEQRQGLFIESAIAFVVARVDPGWIGMWENIRQMPGFPPTNDEHAHGAACKRCITRKLLLPIGFAAPQDTPSHGSEKKLYRRTHTY